MITICLLIFICGYLLITLEGIVKMNKAATALITGILLWVIYFNTNSSSVVSPANILVTEMGKISQILFFLLGAMTIVEVIDSEKGFYVIMQYFRFNTILKLWWAVGIVTFFLSALIDNLTATIVMVTIVSKILSDKKNLLLFASMIVISSNAGGAWSPIGDVTTTMLWIGEQISSWQLILHLLLPSILCFLIAQLLLARDLNKSEKFEIRSEKNEHGQKILLLGSLIILIVPIAKTFLHVPPFLSMLFGLAIIWIYVEVLNRKREKGLDIANALQKIDTPTILFFLGILLSVGALEQMSILHHAAEWISGKVQNIYIVNGLIGLFSAVVDNVPIVAAMQGMFSLDVYPKDHGFWLLLAYCAGTGGSILIIGSAAGVAAMGIQKIDFVWYLKKVSFIALISYISGLLLFFLLHIQ
jgi:Na+/H+ antiporter NhaD/arsenite permease-like protein